MLNNTILMWIGCIKVRQERKKLQALFVKNKDLMWSQLDTAEKYWDVQVDRCNGRLDQIHIQSKIAEKYSSIAHDKALDAISRVGALEKSTHSVRFVPMEQKAEGNDASMAALRSMLNPGNEDATSWMDPIRNDDGEANFF